MTRRPDPPLDLRFVFLRGLVGSAFSIATILAPPTTGPGLTRLFGAFVIADGVLALLAATTSDRPQVRWRVEGLTGFGFGLVAVATPPATLQGLVDLALAWVLLSGLLKIAASARRHAPLGSEWLAIVAFVSSTLGALALEWPLHPADAIPAFVAAYAIAHGLPLMAFAWRFRRRGAGLARA